MSGPAARPVAVDRPVFAIAMMLVAVGLWALHDALAKNLAETYGVAQILVLRSIVSVTLVGGVLIATSGTTQFRTGRPGLNLLRGVLSCVAIGLFTAALPRQPLVSTFAIIASGPLFITILSIPLLREPVGLRRWLATLAGFAAVLFMLQPGSDVDPTAGAMLIVCNVFFAFTMILSRIVGRTDSAGTMTLYTLLTFVVVNGAIAPFDWTVPGDGEWWVFVAIGVIAAAALYAMTAAFTVGAPSLVAPFEYTGIAWAALFGWLFWGEVPSTIVTIGAFALVLCGLYLLHRERIANRRSRPIAADVFSHEGPSDDDRA
jgi:drug/metabolite transporter (DMT)-like permease